MKQTSKTRQSIRLHLLFVWGFISFLMLAADDMPGHRMSEAAFFGSKIAGMISLTSCCLTGRWLNRRGLLPEIKEEDGI